MKDCNIEKMREWFHSKFEDPAMRTPYESKEGGYLYIWGGPYDAREVLEGEFSGKYSVDEINDIVSELEGEGYEWAKIPDDEMFDGMFYDFSSPSQEFYNEFKTSLNNIREMVNEVNGSRLESKFFNIFWVNAITVLETYLSDVFISTVCGDEVFQNNLLNKSKEFTSHKIKLNEFYKNYSSVDEYIKEYLLDSISWHNIRKVKELFKCSIGIDIDEIDVILNAIAVRHHIVHRNGKDKKGDVIKISKEKLDEVLEEIELLAETISNCIEVEIERNAES